MSLVPYPVTTRRSQGILCLFEAAAPDLLRPKRLILQFLFAVHPIEAVPTAEGGAGEERYAGV